MTLDIYICLSRDFCYFCQSSSNWGTIIFYIRLRKLHKITRGAIRKDIFVGSQQNNARTGSELAEQVQEHFSDVWGRLGGVNTYKVGHKNQLYMG